MVAYGTYHKSCEEMLSINCSLSLYCQLKLSRKQNKIQNWLKLHTERVKSAQQFHEDTPNYVPPPCRSVDKAFLLYEYYRLLCLLQQILYVLLLIISGSTLCGLPFSPIIIMRKIEEAEKKVDGLIEWLCVDGKKWKERASGKDSLSLRGKNALIFFALLLLFASGLDFHFIEDIYCLLFSCPFQFRCGWISCVGL